MGSSSPIQIRDVFSAVRDNLNEAGLKWYTEDDIMASIQEAYNKSVILLGAIEKSTFIPQQSTPYYNLAVQIPDFAFVSGIYNPATLLWLSGMSYKLMKSTYQTYLAIGNPQYYNVQDFRRIIIWPYLPAASGVLFLTYKATAPIVFIPGNGVASSYVSYDHTPLLPYSVALPLLEYFSTADLLEQAREFTKATDYWNRLLKPDPTTNTSVLEQARKEIKDLARADHETVLEPYRWIFHGGASGNVTWINNETPSGTIDGVNATFVLAQVPTPTSSVLLTKNGQILYNSVGYTLSGATITFQTGYIPQPASGGDLTGDLVRAWYQIN